MVLGVKVAFYVRNGQVLGDLKERREKQENE